MRACMRLSPAPPSSSGCSGTPLFGWRPGPFRSLSATRDCALRTAPHPPRDLNHSRELRAPDLLRVGAVLGRVGAKPALRAQPQLSEVNIPPSPLDPPQKKIAALPLGCFGGDESEPHDFSRRHRSQWCECSGPRIVIF